MKNNKNLKINEKIEKRCLLVEIKGDLTEMIEKYMPTTKLFIDCGNYQVTSIQIKDIAGQTVNLQTTEKGEILVFYMFF